MNKRLTVKRMLELEAEARKWRRFSFDMARENDRLKSENRVLRGQWVRRASRKP